MFYNQSTGLPYVTNGLPMIVNVPTGVDWFVDQSVATSGDGTSATTAFKTFDEAEAAMSAGLG